MQQIDTSELGPISVLPREMGKQPDGSYNVGAILECTDGRSVEDGVRDCFDSFQQLWVHGPYQKPKGSYQLKLFVNEHDTGLLISIKANLHLK